LSLHRLHYQGSWDKQDEKKFLQVSPVWFLVKNKSNLLHNVFQNVYLWATRDRRIGQRISWLNYGAS
jgi:hypothetical protein